MFIRLWKNKKRLQINRSWFKQPKGIKCRSKSNSANTICWTIKKYYEVNADGTQSMFALTILEKIKQD